MTTLLLKRAAAALLPLFAASYAPIDSPAFAPEEGTTLTKSFTLVLSSDLDDTQMLMNGDDSMSPEMELSSTLTRTLVVTDEIVSMGSGQPKLLQRSFDKVGLEILSPVSMSMQGMDMDAEMHYTGTSPLESKTVKFTWDADAEAYSTAWVDDESDTDPLTDLLEDMDFRGLLPAADTSVGESWDVDPEAIIGMLFAGGELSWEIESIGDEAPMGMGGEDQVPSPRDAWLGLGESSASARLAESRTNGDREIAVIEFEVEIEAVQDISEQVLEGIQGNLPDGAEIDIEVADTESMLEGKGVLLWDVAGGHALSLEFSGETSSEQVQEMALSIGGQDMDIESTTSMSGEFTLTVVFTRQ